MDGSCSRPQDTRRTSEILRQFLEDHPGEQLTLGDLVIAMGDRAYGVLLLVFALPNMLPIAVPGMTAVLGIPLVLFSAQLAAGRPTPSLPAWAAGRSVSRDYLLRLVDRAVPHLERTERLLRPRCLSFISRTGQHMIGVCFVLSIIIALPVPLGNMLPALALSILALAILERDGVAAIVGHSTALASLIIVALVLVSLVEAFVFFLGRAFD